MCFYSLILDYKSSQIIAPIAPNTPPEGPPVAVPKAHPHTTLATESFLAACLINALY